MNKIPYDASRKSLYKPGEAGDFFLFGIDLTNDANLCAEMSRLAYVKEEHQLKAYLERAGFELYWSIGYGKKGTQVFIAKTKQNTDSPKLVAAFRGTEGDDSSDLLADAILLKTPWFDALGNPSGEVHTGFANALLADSSNGNILEKLNSRLNDLAGQFHDILLTGHSLGAALATLTADYLKQSPLANNIHLYTFGSPLVGDSVFSELMSDVKHERYVNCCDLVTRIPPESLGYRHTGVLHYIIRDGRVIDSITEDDIAKDRLAAAAAYVADYSYRLGTVWVRDLADHSPVNYLSGVAEIRS
ncbi:MAG: lipase family protein [Methylococcaceae bacterium]|nr:lipase family protein [Methylococcaceae bacterium]MDZ4155377.1 lipase family protein [Methylococcales bacterium]MDP2392929.1 lipase family protein [Methylococcaceae bacterium]MDP3018263.1 lipase family protein [Methylococcaceae bacterium]MDP3391003.1 lipase family protein [Methylococcaceae bacterium]